MIETTSYGLGELRLPFSAPSTYAATGVHHGYATVELVDNWRWRPAAEPFKALLKPRDPIWAVAAVLSPGGFIAPHRDKGPLWTRHHYTLDTAGWWWDEQNGFTEWPDGEWVRVDHGIAHAVGNPTAKPRVHLIVDTEPRTYSAALTFERYPDSACSRMAALTEGVV